MSYIEDYYATKPEYYGDYGTKKPQPIQVKLKKLTTTAVVPKYATTGSACFDLVADEAIVIEPGQTIAVSTGLAFEIPEGYQMKIHPRSGISLKTTLRVANAPGCVDEDFRGEVKVLLWNSHSGVGNYGKLDYNVLDLTNTLLDTGKPYPYHSYFVSIGDRIAQAEIIPVIQASFEVVDELSKTERGEGGFGSTGC